MPAEKEWRKYFHPKKTLEKFGLREGMVLLDLGCGYGTFSLAAASIVGKKGLVYSLDIDEKMIKRVARKAQLKGLKNVRAMVADISSFRNVVLPSADIALFANVIHGTGNKVQLLKSVKRLLKPRGRVVVMNWKIDENTPRGPPMELRPTKEDTLEYLRKAGYESAKVLDVPPFHYAVVAFSGKRGHIRRQQETRSRYEIKAKQRTKFRSVSQSNISQSRRFTRSWEVKGESNTELC
jgi:ubiquinone/menaquinone biosynthesis C-methylase UbiE